MKVSDPIRVPTNVIIYHLLNLLDHIEEEEKDVRMIILDSAGRLVTLFRAFRFMFVGLIVTNTVWIAHSLGYV